MRNPAGSLLQGLNMMNNNFVMSRIHADNNGSNVQRLVGMTNDPRVVIEELYLAPLSRYPSPSEAAVAADVMRQTGVRRGAEPVQWALLNKLEFLFSYGSGVEPLSDFKRCMMSRKRWKCLLRSAYASERPVESIGTSN